MTQNSNRLRHARRWVLWTLGGGFAAALALLILVQPLQAVSIAAYGDSNTAGTDTAYPGLLQTTLAARYGEGRFTVTNHGVSGLTSTGLVNRLTQTSWLDENPDIALIMIGGNDLRAIETNPSQAETILANTVANVQAAVNLIRTHNYSNGNVPKIIVSAYIPNRLPNVIFAGISVNPNVAVQLFNEALAAQLQDVDVFFTDNYDDILDPLTQKARSSLMADNIHINQAGRQIVADNFADVIITVVPEPSSLALAALGCLAVFGVRWRRR